MVHAQLWARLSHQGYLLRRAKMALPGNLNPRARADASPA